ncbi:MAG: SHOCT domain-containing protein [Gammaproteobacteria bacterium]
MGVAPSALAIDLLPDLGFGKSKEEGKALFTAGLQHVTLVKQESDGGAKPPPNEHPAEFSADQISMALHALTLQHTGGVIVEKQEDVPLFTDREIAVLAPNIARGLSRAQPDEELTFLISGLHAGVLGKESAATTGRVFFVNGKLNLILGEVYKPMVDKGQKERALAAGCGDCPMDDRTIYFAPASRYHKGDLPEPLATAVGVDFAHEGAKLRNDWIVLDVDTIVANMERQRNRLPPALEKERREAKLEAARAAVERRQMREEMARMRKEMQDGGSSSASSASTAQTAEERIATLDKLKKKGLITQEEYDSRRKAILDNI